MTEGREWDEEVKARGVWTQTAAYFPHLSAESGPWGNCSYVWGRGSFQFYYTNTVTCSVLYIWSHSKCAYWKLFITWDKGEIDMSHMCVPCGDRCLILEVFLRLCLVMFFIFLLPAFLSHSLTVSVLLGISALNHFPPCLCTCFPLRGLVPFHIYQHVLTGWVPTCFSSAAEMKWLLPSHIWRVEYYLYMLNFSAAVISFVHLDKNQLWAGNVLSGNLRRQAVKRSCQIFFD